MHDETLALAILPDEWTQCFILWKALHAHSIKFPSLVLSSLAEQGLVVTSRIHGITYYKPVKFNTVDEIREGYSGVPTPPFPEPDKINVQVSCQKWNYITRTYKTQPYIDILIYVSYKDSWGKRLTYRCYDPFQLWHFLRQLVEDPVGMMDLHFNYKPPTTNKTSQSLPKDLKELFND